MTGAITASTYDGKTDNDRLQEAEAILADRNAGMRVSEMCTKYGVSQATLYRRLDAAIASRLIPTVEAYRERQNALYDDLMAKWTKQLAVADVMAEHAMTTESMADLERAFKMRADALVGCERIAARRDRLNGLEAPVKVEARVTVSSPVDDAVAALVRDIETAAAG